MMLPRLRPRLDVTDTHEPAVIAALVDTALRRPDAPCEGLSTDQQIDLRIRPEDVHFWSPQLKVVLRPDEGGRTRMLGHFGPNSNLWTLFMAAYGFVVLSMITGVFYGSAQLMLREYAWALWTLPIGAVCLVVIYAAAAVGQRWGHDQTEVLERFLSTAVQDDDVGGTPVAR